jgi:hypothetical protein
MRVIRAKGLSESDKVLAQTVALRVVQTFRMRARRGKVESATRTKGVCVWRINAATGRAHRRAIGRRPADLAEHRFRFRLGHTKYRGQREGLGGGGEEKVLRHCHHIRYFCNEYGGIQ